MTDGTKEREEWSEAAGRLRRLKSDILRTWELRVRSEVQAARGQSRAVILNSIPKLLDQIAESLESGSARLMKAPAAAQEHADQRASLREYSLEQVVYEYHLLRRVVVDMLEEHSPLPRLGGEAVHDGIDHAVQVAINEYVAREHKALRESEERFRLLVAGVQDYAIFMLDPNGHIVTWNAGAQRINGYTAEEILGQHFSVFYAPADRSAGKPERGLATALALGSFRDEGCRVRKDGTDFWADVLITALRTGDGTLRGFAKVTRDTTERRRLEKALQQQVEDLAVANRAKDEFLAMLSHELRNPLAPILNAAHIIRRVATDDPVLQQAESIIERKVRHMSRLVDDLFDMARISRGRVALRLELAEMSVLVWRSVESVRPNIDERGHHLTVTMPPDSVWLQADPVRLEQVFVNLLDNAAKYTDPGGHIWVTGRREGDQGVVSVRDSGAGIAPELLPRVFEVFAQGQQTLDRSRGGLGIGLALARTLVEMHGGTIEAHSEGSDRGSEFVVRLPVASPPTEGSVELDASERETAVFRILVVDDHVDSADTLAMFLQLQGHEVQVAYSGPDAVKAARAQRPDVTFLDIGLPGMDGYEVARQLREHRLVGRILVALTGYGQDSDKERTRLAGFDYHLVKPVDPTKVQELLSLLTERPALSRDSDER